jgi:UDP-N-acetylmuramyl pentapeptide phosphotransferase/UDP-N-acetylglucosamine-1-phosphate transferase
MAPKRTAGYNRTMSTEVTFFVASLFMLSIASLAATGLVLRILQKHQILDHPVGRSSHSTPTPRGGGIAVIALLLIALYVWSRWSGEPYFPGPVLSGTSIVLLAAIALAITSWIDDLRTLSPVTRIVTHTAAVIAAMVWVGSHGMIFQNFLPFWYDAAAAALLWLWFVNLFNFMDGIDGIAGVEAASVSAGIAIVAYISPTAGLSPWPGAALAAVSIGFLWWNWHPAKIFLGDVGSVPLGFLLGWLLIETAAAGLWAPAIILPLYYLLDATVTLGRRILRRERIWEAHREHFYQLAIQRGRSHAAVSLAVALANIILIALAIASLTQPLPAIIGAAFVVAMLLIWMLREKHAAAPTSVA